MSHNHNHDSCDHESHNSGYNDSDAAPQDNLFQYIDRSNVVALNASEDGSKAIKPWHERLDETVSVESDADDQLILRVPFVGSVKLRALLLKTGPADQTPTKVALFANEASFDFEDAGDKIPTQEFDVAQGREVGEYAVRAAKFSNISSITLFFPSSQGADTTQIYYVGFLGHWTERKANPVITVYEAQANPADHERIQGMDQMFSAPQS